MNSSARYFEVVARRILAAHPAPDLRGITVLLPNMHAAQPLARALQDMAQTPVILLPKMVTLDQWAQEVALDAVVMTDRQRSALLYRELKQRQWFVNTDLWSMTQELIQLFDELTAALDVLPDDEAAFVAAVERACQARQNATLQLEAHLVFELWHAMQAGRELDAARAYQQRLAQLAARAQSPLYVLMTSEWEAVERRFLDAYGQRARVEVFDLREMAGQRAVPSFFAATSLEQEARAAAMQVRLWLRQGKRDIAIVAQDRVAARRLRALLERFEVWVTDETGWTFATLAVSTVVERWLTVLQSDFYHHDLLDLLKSPFIFADMGASERKSAVYAIERLLRRHGVVSGLKNFQALVPQEATLQGLLARLEQAAAVLDQRKKRTLAAWVAALRDSLSLLGIDRGLQQDEAGLKLLSALETWRQELTRDAGTYVFQEWRRWLAQQLDLETFRDSGIESPVRLTHLAATRWRAFDAVLLLGCDADHLPSVADGGRWFNDAVRAALNLPTRAFHAQRQRADLHALLAMNDTVLVAWQKEQGGEPRLLSPFLQLLREDYDDDLSGTALHAHLAAEDARCVGLPPAVRPAPAVAPERVPGRVSISAYNALVACPYQFYARHILKLNELDEVQETIEKRDYGERVHLILQRFHQQFPQVSEKPLSELETALHRISEEVFGDLLAQDFAAHAWLLRWYQSLPAYLEWQRESEAQGWRFAEAEKDFEIPLQGVVLRGRIDRLDESGDGKRVLDYKMQDNQLLRNKLKEPGEDVQLACYALAQQAMQAAFVGIEKGRVTLVAPQEDISLLARLNAERLENVMAALRGGAGLVANGSDAACVHCEMRGVCRKGDWT